MVNVRQDELQKKLLPKINFLLLKCKTQFAPTDLLKPGGSCRYFIVSLRQNSEILFKDLHEDYILGSLIVLSAEQVATATFLCSYLTAFNF